MWSCYYQLLQWPPVQDLLNSTASQTGLTTPFRYCPINRKVWLSFTQHRGDSANFCFIRNALLLCRHWRCSLDCQLYLVAINLQQIPQVPLTPMGSDNNTAWDPAKPAHNNAVQRLNRCKLFLPLLNFEQLCSQHFINKDSAFRLTFKELFKHLIRLLKIQLCP